MTENEKRIVTLLSKQGPLSKKELSEQGQISWATVVKIISRFEQSGILHHVGTDAQPETTGKDPLVYALSDRNPIAVGIDVSYAMTHIILTNLKHNILAQDTYETPTNPDKTQFRTFLATIFSQFAEKVLSPGDSLAGVGIGIPRWLVTHTTNIFSELSEELTDQLQTNVCVENCIRSYTLYQKWIGEAFSLNDFILLEIRDGVGTGIVYQGNLFRGTHGGAGALSHLTILEDGKPCRCGKRGCLETLLNQDILYQNYVKNVQKKDPNSLTSPSEAEIHRGLGDLFSLTQQGHREASAIVQEAARYIGMGIATLLLILDIPHVIIAADFGPDGMVIVPHIEQEVNRRIVPDIEYSVVYYPHEWPGFAQGAPLLIFKDYFTEIPSV